MCVSIRPCFWYGYRDKKVRDFNEARREMRVTAAKETREQDLVLLEYAIQKDKAGENEEKAKREEEKRVSSREK